MIVKTAHVVILAAAILGAAWILKPAPVEQISQAGLQERERLERFMREGVTEERVKQCAASIGKTPETLDQNDPQQGAPYRKCMWPELEQGWVRRTWNRMLSALMW